MVWEEALDELVGTVGLSSEAVAQQLRVHSRTVRRWRSGVSRPVPRSEEDLVALAGRYRSARDADDGDDGGQGGAPLRQPVPSAVVPTPGRRQPRAGRRPTEQQARRMEQGPVAARLAQQGFLPLR